MITLMVKTLKDLTNGAAFHNQELVYQLGIDVFMNTLLRIIDDITDEYYIMKEEIMAFLLGLLEGSNKDIMNYIAYNFDVTILYSQVITLVKKCFVIEAKKQDIINSLPKAEQEPQRQRWLDEKKIAQPGRGRPKPKKTPPAQTAEAPKPPAQAKPAPPAPKDGDKKHDAKAANPL